MTRWMVSMTKRLVLNFRGIPEGVTVTASLMGTGEAMEEDGTDLAPLMLNTGRRFSPTHADEPTAWSVCHRHWRGGDHVHFRHVWVRSYDHDGDMSWLSRDE